MATPNVAAKMTVGDYMASSFRPDCDFTGGRLVERHLGEFEHARLQAILASWFFGHERGWNVRTVVEQTVQVLGERFRIPGVCVLRRDNLIEQIIRTAPLLLRGIRTSSAAAQLVDACDRNLR